MQYAANTVRIRLDVKKDVGTAIDATASSSPSSYWGADLIMQFALDENGTLLDVANVVTLNVEIKPFEDRLSGSVIPAKLSGSFDTSLSENTWSDGSKQHTSVSFTGAEIKTIEMNGDLERKLWCVVWGTTTGGVKVVWGIFTLRIVNSGAAL